MKPKILITGICGILLLVVFTVFLPVGTCEETENETIIYVDDDYDNTTIGWDVDHFNNIQTAIDAASNGDTVYVCNGTYYEHVVIDKTITLCGEDKNNTIIDGSGSSNIINISANRVNITGFTIRNGEKCCGKGGIYIKSHDNNMVTGNIITDTFSGVYLCSSSNNTIAENIITKNECGLYLRERSNNNIISRNTIIDNRESGLFLFREATDNNISKNIINNNEYIGIYLSRSSNNNNIYKNTITNNSIGGICLYRSSESNIIAENTIIHNNEYGIFLFNKATDNTISKNTITNSNIGINITADSNNNHIFNDNIFLNNNENIHDESNINKSKTPGFELVFAICSIVLILLWQQRDRYI